MRLVELLNITSPNLLLEAAKDRYMQILPDSFYAKIIPEPNETSNALWNTVKKDFSENVTWAMQHLQRADRITWFLRYAKLRAIRLFLEQLKQYDSEFAISTGGQVEFQQAREALEQQVKRDTDKLIKATLADSQTLIEQLKNNMDVAFQKKSKIDSECQGRSDTNCRSRMTNARRVAEYTHDVYQITQTNYLRGNPSALPTIVRNEVSNFSEPRTGWGGFDQIKGNIEHFMSIPAAEIQNFKFGAQSNGLIRTLFQKYEEVWAEKQARSIPEKDPSWGGAEKIIEFPDGMVWWNLHKSYCKREGEAMGHCGNSYRADRPVEVLTLREPVKGEMGETNWKVNLTFIWNYETGMIVESKGFKNQKPDEKYHPYIIELLKQPWIKGFDQAGTHAEENNFHLSDLDKETEEELTTLNPRLAGAIPKKEFEDNHTFYKNYKDGTAWFMTGSEDQLTYAVDMANQQGEFWIPKVIATFNDRGHTTVMGPDNDKPDFEYRDVILDALMHFDEIQSFTRGDYSYFSLADLSEEERVQLFQKKPSFASAEYIYKQFGPGEKFVQKVNDDFEVIDSYHEMHIDDELYDDEYKAFAVGDSMSLRSFLENRSSDDHNGIWVYKLLTGDEHMDMYDTPSPDSSEMNQILDKFKQIRPNEYMEMVDYIIQNHFEEDSDVHDYFEGNEKAAREFLAEPKNVAYHYDDFGLDDIEEALGSAHRTGVEYGAEAEAYEHLQSYLMNLPRKETGNNYDGYSNNDVFYKVIPDGECYTCDTAKVQQYITVNFILEVLNYQDADWLKRDYWEVRGLGDPPSGWGYYGYDLDAAAEEFGYRLSEML